MKAASTMLALVTTAMLLPAGVRADESETEVDLGHWGHWPDVSLCRDGTLQLVYTQCEGPDGEGACQVRYRQWSGGAWSAEETVPDSGDVTAHSNNVVNRPRVACDDDGRAHVVWGPPIHETTYVRYARRETGGTWSTHDNATDHQGEGLDVEVHDALVFVGAHVLGEGTYSYSRAVDCNTGAWLEFAHGGVGKGVSLSRSVDGATLRLNWWWLLGGGQGYGYHVWSFSGEGWSESDDIGNLPDTSPADGSMIVDADGQQAIAFTTWQDMGGGDYDPVAVHIVEHDGTLVTISSEAPPEEQDSNPTPLADPQGHRYIIWRDRSAQLRYSNDLAWSDDGWIPDAVFPTLSEVYQPTAATGGGYTHLLWRDEAGHLRHNPRPNELDSILMGHDLAGCVTTGEPRDVTVCAYNTGTQAWPAGLVTATPTHQADPLAVADHSVSFIDRDVPPGDHDCVVISTVTPLDEGSQTSSWHLAVDVGDGPWPFGDPLTVNFETSIDCATGDDDDDTASGDGGDGGDGGDEGCSCSSATPRMEPRVTLGVALVIALLYRRRAHRRGNNNPVRAL